MECFMVFAVLALATCIGGASPGNQSETPIIIDNTQAEPRIITNNTQAEPPIIINNDTLSSLAPATEINPPSSDPPTTASPSSTKPTQAPNNTNITTSTTKPTPSTKLTTVVPTTTTPNATTQVPTNVTTVDPTIPTKKPGPLPVTTAAPAHIRKFDGPSFVGGIVLALGMVAIAFVAFKFYKARTELNYHTL